MSNIAPKTPQSNLFSEKLKSLLVSSVHPHNWSDGCIAKPRVWEQYFDANISGYTLGIRKWLGIISNERKNALDHIVEFDRWWGDIFLFISKEWMEIIETYIENQETRKVNRRVQEKVSKNIGPNIVDPSSDGYIPEHKIYEIINSYGVHYTSVFSKEKFVKTLKKRFISLYCWWEETEIKIGHEESFRVFVKNNRYQLHNIHWISHSLWIKTHQVNPQRIEEKVAELNIPFHAVETEKWLIIIGLSYLEITWVILAEQQEREAEKARKIEKLMRTIRAAKSTTEE